MHPRSSNTPRIRYLLLLIQRCWNFSPVIRIQGRSPILWEEPLNENTEDSTLSAQDCLNRGNTFYNQKDYQSAISEYNEAIRLNPDFSEPYNRRGIVKAEIRQHSEALSDFDTAIRLNPDSAEAYSNRGV
ncbi:tetratricopeptide repeat protein [Candidatus Poribacteria bacterium]|nr:tetratricopeptide repeat protein [Candidatus Poribacteria bacterium]MYA58469.1 tetratricopeptide repeat protein [Candidatus Poribacteria bacterium]